MDTSVNKVDVAEQPTKQSINELANSIETGAVEQESTDNIETVETSDNTQEVAEPEQSFKDDKQNQAFAAMRREKEAAQKKAEELEKQVQERDKWVKDTYGHMGINNWDEYQQALKEQERKQKEQQWKDQGIDPEVIKQIMQNDPDIQQMKEKLTKYEQEMQQKQIDQQLNTEIETLNKEYGLEIKSIDDIAKLDNADTIIDYAKKGLELKDAYFLANKDNILSQQTAAERQKTLNNINGKSHIKGNGEGGNDLGKSIPPEVVQMYKELNPGITMEEIQKHYKG